MKIVFLGTPEIAKTCLESLYNSKHEILAVITKIDKPSGRGNKVVETPVKVYAKSVGLPVYQFENFKQDGTSLIEKLKPDALVLVAFGVILPQKLLEIAIPINLHGSLLPAYRGASPIQTAILNGETESGITIMRMNNTIDGGDILLQEKVEITPNDTSKTLFDKMASVGGNAILKALELIENNKAVWIQQDNSKATYTQILTKENARINFNDTTNNIVNKIRAYNPNPVAYFILGGIKFKVYSAKKVEFNTDVSYKNGEIVVANSKNGLIIKTNDGFVEIITLQAPNKSVLLAKSLLNGLTLKIGSIIE